MKTERPVPTAELPRRLLLRFVDPDLKPQFVSSYTNFYYRFAQASLLLGLILVFGDFAGDFFTYPGVTANFRRLSICAPVLVAALTYSFHSHAKKRWEPVMSATVVLIAMALFWVLVDIDAQGGQGLDSWVGVLNFSILQLYCFGACQKFCVQGITFHPRSIHASYFKDSKDHRGERQGGAAATQPANARRAHPGSCGQAAIRGHFPERQEGLHRTRHGRRPARCRLPVHSSSVGYLKNDLHTCINLGPLNISHRPNMV